jgi:hypothetical protein
MNWALSNLYRQAANFGHYMKRGKDIEKERPNSLLAAYRAGPCLGGHLDIIGVECVENLKIFFPASADISRDDGRIQNPLPRVEIAIRLITKG